VRPDSPAARVGLLAGDVLQAINGHVLHDIIDYRFYSAEEVLALTVARSGGALVTVAIERDYGSDLGLEFEQPTFDGIRTCRNRCEFCFVGQMPPGLRSSLYLRDDDYRYSFLYGNFITLTNLDETDWDRIGEQGLSPLYVSVHATDPCLRARLLGRTKASDVLSQIRRLRCLGIAVHCQIVITPGLNDGAALARTVEDLASLHPTVLTIGIVPVGLTRYHHCGQRTLTPSEAGSLLDWMAPLQTKYRQQTGAGLAYAADEIYLMAGRSVPSSRSYDGFPQLDNGIGLTRRLLDDWSRVKRRASPDRWTHGKTTLVCGMLIAPTLRRIVAELEVLVGASITVVPVENGLFGPTVTVSGLLAASDVVGALGDRALGDTLALPRTMFDASGQLTLDDRDVPWIENRLQIPIVVVDSLGMLLKSATSDSKTQAG